MRRRPNESTVGRRFLDMVLVSRRLQVVSTDLKLHGVKVGGIEGAASGDAQQRETEEVGRGFPDGVGCAIFGRLQAMPSVFTAQEVKKVRGSDEGARYSPTAASSCWRKRSKRTQHTS